MEQPIDLVISKPVRDKDYYVFGPFMVFSGTYKPIKKETKRKRAKLKFCDDNKNFVSLFHLLPRDIWVSHIIPELDVKSRGALSKAHPHIYRLITTYFNHGLILNPGFTFYDHQEKAIAWIKERESQKHHGVKGGILSLTMGLGKTFISIASILFCIMLKKKEMENNKPKSEEKSIVKKSPTIKDPNDERIFPSLIVCSKTLMTHWKLDFRKFFGDRVKVLYLHKKYMGKSFDSISRKDILNYDFVITTYNVVDKTFYNNNYEVRVIDYDENQRIMGVHETKLYNKPDVRGPAIIFNTPWYKVVADESHKFANYKTKIFKAMMAIWGRYKWCLTGTPFRNKETDIFHQLRFCGYKGCEKDSEWDSSKMEEHKLNDVIMRMSYKDANIVLPEKKIHNIEIDFESDEERKAYDYFKDSMKQQYKGMMLGSVGFGDILAMFTRLRQACIAPFIITDESKRKNKGKKKNIEKDVINNLDNLTGGLESWIHDKNGTAGLTSSKMKKIISIIKSIPQDEKILIFSKFTCALDTLSEALKKEMPEFKICMIDGDTSEEEREEFIEKFKSRPNIRGMLLSYDVGSEGLNLTEANHVICIEQWWCPYVHDQAESRCWRFGQTKTVNVYRIFLKDSIESNMVKMIYEKKEQLADDLITTVKPEKLDKYKLGKLLNFM